MVEGVARLGTRARNRLSAVAVRAAVASGRDALLADGGGLWLRVRDGRASWLLRLAVDGKRRERGLGSVADVSLAEAREQADAARRAAVRGGHAGVEAVLRPVLEVAPVVLTVADVLSEYVEKVGAGWRNEKHRAQWSATLNTHAGPVMNKPIGALTAGDVATALRPIWTTKPETASRVRQRIEALCDYAAAHGWRDAALANPAGLRLIGKLMPARPRGEHKGFTMVEPSDAPALFLRLWAARGEVGSAAVCAVALAALRSGEVRAMRWEWIGADSIVIPGEFTKTGRAHDVSIAAPLRTLLEERRKVAAKNATLVFPGPRTGAELSDMSLLQVHRRLGEKSAVHGWRSGFRTWAQSAGISDAVAERCLAHVESNKTIAAYARHDFKLERADALKAWAAHLMSGINPD